MKFNCSLSRKKNTRSKRLYIKKKHRRSKKRSLTIAAPILKKRPMFLHKHGDTRMDPYHHIRDKSKSVMKHIGLENKYTLTRFKPYTAFHTHIVNELKSYEHLDDVSLPVQHDSYWYYLRTKKDLEYPLHYRFPVNASPTMPILNVDTILDEEVLIFDENKEGKGHSYYDVHDIDISPDDRWMCVLINTSGSEEYQLSIMRMGTTVPIQPSFAACDMIWLNVPSYMVYCTLDKKHRPYQVWRYQVEGKHELIYQEDDELFSVDISESRNERVIFIHSTSTCSSEVYALSTDSISPLTRLEERRTNIISHWDQCTINGVPHWFRRTNEDAREYKLQLKHSQNTWIDVVPSHDTYVEEYALYSDFLVWSERIQGDLVAFWAPWSHLDGILLHTHRINGHVSPSTVDIDNKSLKHTSSFFRISISSMIHPSTIYDVDYKTGSKTLIRYKPVPNYDETLYTTQRIWVNASDGVRIPVSVMHLKSMSLQSLHKPHPMLLYGYGSYSVCDDSHFTTSILPLVNRGVIYAVAHVRGGGECGKWWYEMGKLDKKENTFTDFIAVAHYFIDHGITTSRQLAAQGGSAGGLLMGAVMNLEPSLFHAVIADVPFVDVLTTMLDPSLPLSIAEREEWGNPEEKRYYDIIKRYSPYDTIKKTVYPHVYVTTGLNDPRVGFWEPAKWVLALRDAHKDNQIFLYAESVGHSGGTMRSHHWTDEATRIVFILTEIVYEKSKRNSLRKRSQKK